jgi:hypothetical protein
MRLQFWAMGDRFLKARLMVIRLPSASNGLRRS